MLLMAEGSSDWTAGQQLNSQWQAMVTMCLIIHRREMVEVTWTTDSGHHQMAGFLVITKVSSLIYSNIRQMHRYSLKVNKVITT